MGRIPYLVAARIILTIFVLLSLGIPCISAKTNDLVSTNTHILLEKVQAAMKNAGIDLPGAAIDNGSEMLAKTPAFLVLQSQVVGNWQQVLNNFQSIAPSDVEKEIFLVVCESSLPPNTYLEFVDRLTKLVEDGTVDKQFLLWALFPVEKNTRGIFDDKYNSATTLDIIKRAKIIYSSNSNITRFCDAILNNHNRDKINF